MRDRSLPSQPANETTNPQQAQEALRQALSSLRAGPGTSTLSPEELAELARRAGYSSPGGMAELGRMMSLNAGTSGVGLGAAVPQHIFFLLGDMEYVLPTGAVQSVERIGDIAMVPNTAPWILGVVQVWGTILSVVDFRQFAGMPPQATTARSRLLVVTRREMTIGFVVDVVTEMRPIGDIVVGPVDSRSTPQWAVPYAQGSLQRGDHLATLLDPDHLLFSDKLQRYRADAG
ncbi:MAG: chemotaxis protein CheW [Ktedonobacterales bacterium]|nr:chemotaxis protein CheW [Ktedonobacterales bacterium]